MMMRRLLRNIFLLLVFLAVAPVKARSQDMKTVSGTITSAEDGSPLSDGITVYTYMTVAEAKDDYTKVKQMLEENSTAEYFLSGYPHSTLGNYYSVQVPSSGALLFFYEDARAVRLEEVKGRLEINVTMKVARQIQKAVVEAESTKPYVTLESIPISGDNEIASAFTFLFSGKAAGRTDARFAIQAYLLDENQTDTLQYFTPVVLDGEKYHLTQLRRKNFDPREDYLYRRAEQAPTLTDTTVSVTYPFKFKLQNRSDVRYFCYKYWMEDYNHVFVQDSAQVFSTARLQDPMQFLDYDLGTFDLNPQDFFVDARRERHNGQKELPLRFMVGRSTIDPSDTSGLRHLEEIREEMARISRDPDASLKELHISGVASPEGNFARNTALAQARMNFLLDRILSVLSSHDRDRVYKSGESRVASWEEVADILDRDSLSSLATQVRGIAESARGGMDTQFARIQRLPAYREEIVPRLPALRTVTCTYLSEVYRKLLPEEILEKYRSDIDYRDGYKQLTLNEYWNLYQLLSDPDELEGLYKRGIRAADEMKYFWPLPANKLATLYIQKNVTDTTLLKPYLHEGFSVNRTIMSMQDPGKYERIWNLDPVVANQVIMLLNAKSSKRAVFWATYLKGLPQYHTLYHIARCLAGYYQVNTEDGRETFQVVSRSSKLNEAVMNMAIQSWSSAEKALNALPQDEARTQYLWAQFLARKYGGGRDYGRMREEVWGTDEFGLDMMVSDAAKASLQAAFKLDGDYRITALKDAYLPEELVADAALEYARELQAAGENAERVSDYLSTCMKMNRNLTRAIEAGFPAFVVDMAKRK